jgi:hypothetical protein
VLSPTPIQCVGGPNFPALSLLRKASVPQLVREFVIHAAIWLFLGTGRRSRTGTRDATQARRPTRARVTQNVTPLFFCFRAGAPTAIPPRPFGYVPEPCSTGARTGARDRTQPSYISGGPESARSLCELVSGMCEPSRLRLGRENRKSHSGGRDRPCSRPYLPGWGALTGESETR